jgi:hypothetical protein
VIRDSRRWRLHDVWSRRSARSLEMRRAFAGKFGPAGAFFVGAPCAPFEAEVFNGAHGAPYERSANVGRNSEAYCAEFVSSRIREKELNPCRMTRAHGIVGAPVSLSSTCYGAGARAARARHRCAVCRGARGPLRSSIIRWNTALAVGWWSRHISSSTGWSPKVFIPKAGREDMLTDVRVQVEMPVAFHRVDKAGEHRLQPLPTNPIRRLPGHDQRLSNRLGNKISESMRQEGRSRCPGIVIKVERIPHGCGTGEDATRGAVISPQTSR